MRRTFAWASAGVVAGALSCVLATARADQGDPLAPLIVHCESFIHRSEDSGGIALDPRHFWSFPEHLRLTVVPQLAAFCDLQVFMPSDSRLTDIVQRADFLVKMGAYARSGDPSDGMLAYALLKAFDVTGNTAYRDAAASIIGPFLVSPVVADPNRALMAGMALAEYYHLTGDPVARTRTSEIVLLAARYQHADGSFDHICDGARDVHYTAWITMELDLIGRLVDDANVARILEQAQGFLLKRVAPDGTISYQDTLASGATIYYYSKPMCSSDYETRGWVNELGYHALWSDRVHDVRYRAIMTRLAGLESQGAFPDKWGYPPPGNDPSYVWSLSPRSVVRTSLTFWTLACIQARRPDRAQVIYTGASATTPAAEAGAGPETAGLSLAPNPAHGSAWITLRLSRPADARVTVLDASGRRVRDLLHEPLAAGTRLVRWDGVAQDGVRAPAGVYFVRLEVEGRVRAARLVWIDSAR